MRFIPCNLFRLPLIQCGFKKNTRWLMQVRIFGVKRRQIRDALNRCLAGFMIRAIVQP